MPDPITTTLVGAFVKHELDKYKDRKKYKKELYRLVARLFARPAYDVSLREVEQLLNEIYEYNPEKPDEFYGLRELENLYNQKRNGGSTQTNKL
ncbi:10161_t:CDS:2 [Paraglomus brasilianum]|uniref:10161_t:CDS:1 n=1 Tax=Paraglomus brasilianum TaxID=144538 RepID=A0A9N9E0V7_9GLOM|nr:10161_t:CDS:2 [Paraglomus brasilianum]